MKRRRSSMRKDLADFELVLSFFVWEVEIDELKRGKCPLQ